MPSTKPITVAMTAREFAGFITPMIPLADQDARSSLPVLNAIRMHSHGGYLYATATDRYVIGIRRFKTDVEDGINAVVPLAVLRDMLRIYKPSKGVNLDLRLSFTDTEVTVESAGLFVAGALTWKLEAGKYPNVASLITPDKFSVDRPSRACVNPTFLAKFAALSDGDPIVLAPTAFNSVVVVTIGDDFIGGIMQVRWDGQRHPDSTRDTLAAWQGAMLAAEPQEKKAAGRKGRAA